MKLFTTLTAVGVMFATGTAMAQDAPMPPPPPNPMPMEQQAMPPAETPETPSQSTSFSDAEIASFAAAMREMRVMRSDPSISDDQRQERADVILAENGLDKDTYNAIGNAAQEDPALADRIGTALSAMETEPGS